MLKVKVIILIYIELLLNYQIYIIYYRHFMYYNVIKLITLTYHDVTYFVVYFKNL